MKWIEAKMAELGTLRNDSYKIAMLVDDGAMITVQDEQGRVVRYLEGAASFGLLLSAFGLPSSEGAFFEGRERRGDAFFLFGATGYISCAFLEEGG